MPYVLATVNLKGGVAKTTTALHLGYALAQSGMRVRLIDLDTDACLTDALYGDVAPGRASVLDALREPARGLAAATERVNKLPLRGRLDLVLGADEVYTAPKAFALAQGRQPVATFPQVLPYLLSQHCADCDVVILDPGANWDALNDAMLMAAHAVIVPVVVEPMAVKGLKRFMRRLATNNANRAQAGLTGQTQLAGILVSRVLPDQEEDARAFLGEIDRAGLRRFALLPECAYVPNSPVIPRATGQGVPAWHLDSRDAAARAYLALAEEVAALAA